MTKQFRKKSITYCCAALSLLAASNTFAQSDLPAYDLLLHEGRVPQLRLNARCSRPA